LETGTEIVFNSVPDHYLNILNLLLVGLFVIFVGLSIKDVYKFHAASGVVPAPRTADVPAPQSLRGPRPRSSYDVITERDIFSLAPPPSAPVEDQQLEIKLLGTSHLTTGKPFAIIEDQRGNQSLFRPGDAIPGVGLLLQVGQDRVIVLHNGHRVATAIPRADTSLPEVNAPHPSNLVDVGGRKILIPGF
jgi:hypothetical protein